MASDVMVRVVRPRFKGLLAAAVALVVAVIGVVYSVNGFTRPASSATPTIQPEPSAEWPDSETEREVERFVMRLLHTYPGLVEPAVDWASRLILVPVTPPVTEKLADLDGSDVAGLKVDVFAAVVTRQAYESFILAVGAANFPNHKRVRSFNLPAGSKYIEVRVQGLQTMPAADVDALRADLERLTDSPIVLTQWIKFDQL